MTPKGTEKELYSPENQDEGKVKIRSKQERDFAEKSKNVSPVERQKAQDDLDKLDIQKDVEKSVVIKGSKKALEDLRSEVTAELSNLNNDEKTGTKVIRKERYSHLRGKQERNDQFSKDMSHKFREVLGERAEGATRESRSEIVARFLSEGGFTGLNFERQLAARYLADKFPGHEDASKEDKKYQKELAKGWAKEVKTVLAREGLLDEALKMNRKEKQNERIEKRAQRKTELNKEEVLFTEQQMNIMFETAIKSMGGDAFAKALAKKINTVSPNALNGVKIDSLVALKNVLTSPGYRAQKNVIMNFIKENQSDLTLMNMKEWLTNTPEENADILAETQRQIEDKFGDAIDIKVRKAFESLPAELALDPLRTQEIQRKLRSEVAFTVAAGYMDLVNQQQGARFARAGAGGAMSIDLKRATPLIDNLTIAAGVSNHGELGFGIKLNKSLNWETGEVKGTIGAINFIPLARVGVEQALNARQLDKNIKAKRLVKIGAYAQVMPGYMSTGLTAGNDKLAGIERQTDSIFDGVLNASENITNKTSLQDAVNMLKDVFTKAKKSSLEPVAQYIINKKKEGKTNEFIATALTTEWKNRSIMGTKNGVDLSAQVGVGMLLNIPVVEAFVGMKIYGRSTMHVDKFDRQAKETRMSSFKGFNKLDNADVKDMSQAEKVKYWLGNIADVKETSRTITISTKGNTPIYDQFDVYVKNVADVRVTNNEITFSKASNILMGSIVGAFKDRQKLYIGYDTQKDINTAKAPLNNPILGGKPEAIDVVTVNKVLAKELAFETKETKGVYAEYFDKVKMNCIEATAKVQKEKYKYNDKCQDLFAEINRFKREANTTDEQWMNVVGSFNQLMTEIGAANLDVKAGDPRNEIINQILNTIAYSAKAWNLNMANDKTLSKKEYPQNITTLINRKGAIAAFRGNGYEVADNAFDGLHGSVKGETLYKQVSYPNAVAIVAYYRSVAPGKPMNTTALTGLNGVSLAHSAKGELFRDNSVDAKIQEKLIDELIDSETEFASYKAKVANMLKAANIDAATFTDKMYIDLLSGKKVNRVTLSKEFFKAFNGPCVNEALIMNLIGIHVDGYTITKDRTAEVYVGSENTENYQKAHSINVGVGTMIGNRPAPQKPGKEPETPPVEPPVIGDGDSVPLDNAIDSHVNPIADDFTGDNGDQNP